jgi:RNA polymerase sigma factor (sigma-70 family)
MQRVHVGAVNRGLERLINPGTISGLSESEVLARFVECHDPVAFEAIIVRHGPTVLSVCRQMLRDPNDVDDAFQATFVILIEKAGSLRQPERLGPWLYGVAVRIALRARKRRHSEGLPTDVTDRASDLGPVEREQLAALHEEIGRLPEKYRLPILLCCVEEETHDQAASRLGWPLGTVHGRLSRARELLRERLKRRGMVIPTMIDRPSSASSRPRDKVMPEPLLRATIALPRAAIRTQLQSLVKGALSAMFIEKLKSTGVVVGLSALGLTGATAGLLAFQDPAGKSGPAPVERSVPDSKPGVAETKKAYAKTAGTPEGVGTAANHAAEQEAIAIKVGKLRAEAELLEITAEDLRGRIRDALTLIAQLDEATDFPAMTPVEIDRRERKAKTTRERVKLWQEEYTQIREKIAKCNYQVVSQVDGANFPMQESVDSSESLAAVVRRLDRLEGKVDRLADLISHRTPR